MAERTPAQRWMRAFGWGAGIIATGVLLFNYTVPTEEQLVAQFSPEIRAEYERNRHLRQREQMEVMQIARQTAASDQPIWKTGKIRSPLEKEGRGVNQKLVSLPQETPQLRGQQHQKEQVERARNEAKEREELEATSSRSRWFSWFPWK